MKRKDKPHPLAFLGPPFFEFLGLDPRTHALLLSTSQGARSAPLDPRVEARGNKCFYSNWRAVVDTSEHSIISPSRISS